jgi:hypothetical protein
MHGLPRQIVGIALAMVTLAGGVAQACDVPVFRYALERWRPSVYRVFVFHRGALAGGDKAVVEDLQKQGVDDEGLANLEVHVVDPGGEVPAAVGELWKAQKSPSLPWMVVCYPEEKPAASPAWSGPLSAENGRLVMDSPARKKLAGLIVGGATGVWILLESGDASRDSAAVSVLEGQLGKLEKTLALAEDAAAREAGRPQLKIRFPVLRLSRNDSAERAFVRMLVDYDPALSGGGQPIAFAVFARGRSLCALAGEDINDDNIDLAAQFMAGPCSCEVKEQNPGVDLLMTADWQAALETGVLTQSAVPTLVGLAPAPTAPAAPAAATTRSAAPAVPLASSRSLYRNLLLTGLGSVAVLVVLTVLILVRSRKGGA